MKHTATRNLVIGNLMFAALAYAWCFHFWPQPDVVTKGVVVIYLSFIGGTATGYVLRGRPSTERAAAARAAAPQADVVQARPATTTRSPLPPRETPGRAAWEDDAARAPAGGLPKFDPPVLSYTP